MGPSINFHELFVHLWDYPLTFVNFCASSGPFKKVFAAAGPSVKFRKIFVHPLDFPKAFRVAAGVTVNFSQHSVRQREHLFLCVHGISVNYRPTPPNPVKRPPDPSRHSGRTSRPLLSLQECLPTPAGPLGGPPNHSQTSEWGSLPFQEQREGLPTPPSTSGGTLDPS